MTRKKEKQLQDRKTLVIKHNVLSVLLFLLAAILVCGVSFLWLSFCHDLHLISTLVCLPSLFFKCRNFAAVVTRYTHIWLVLPATLFSGCYNKCVGKAQRAVGCSRVSCIQAGMLATSVSYVDYMVLCVSLCHSGVRVEQKSPSLYPCCTCLPLLLYAMFHIRYTQLSK